MKPQELIEKLRQAEVNGFHLVNRTECKDCPTVYHTLDMQRVVAFLHAKYRKRYRGRFSEDNCRKDRDLTDSLVHLLGVIWFHIDSKGVMDFLGLLENAEGDDKDLLRNFCIDYLVD